MVPAFSSAPNDGLFYSAATLECHAAGMRQDIAPHHIIPTQGQSVIVLSFDVERRTGRYNHLFF